MSITLQNMLVSAQPDQTMNFMMSLYHYIFMVILQISTRGTIMYKEEYKDLSIEVFYFEAKDVITSSDDDDALDIK